MKKKKLSLKELNVESFVTSANSIHGKTLAIIGGFETLYTSDLISGEWGRDPDNDRDTPFCDPNQSAKNEWGCRDFSDQGSGCERHTKNNCETNDFGLWKCVQLIPPPWSLNSICV